MGVDSALFEKVVGNLAEGGDLEKVGRAFWKKHTRRPEAKHAMFCHNCQRFQKGENLFSGFWPQIQKSLFLKKTGFGKETLFHSGEHSNLLLAI